jgi:hypothetical protein
MWMASFCHKAAGLFHRRGGLTIEIAAEQKARHDVLDRIKYFELKALRALREHALGEVSALGRVQAIDDELVRLRVALTGPNRELPAVGA